MEQVVGGKVVANTVSVTEERKTEEIHETPQSAAKDTATLTAASEDGQPPRAVEDLHSVEVVAVSAGNASVPKPPAPAVDERTTPTPTSPETPPPVCPPESTADSAKKDKHHQKAGGSSRFSSLFGKKKKKKKSSSVSEDLKNVDQDVEEDRQKRGSLGRKSPKSADASMNGDGGKRTSGGPFSFLKRSKSKPTTSGGSKVTGSDAVSAVDEGLQGDVGAERIVYQLDVEGDVVAKVTTVCYIMIVALFEDSCVLVYLLVPE